MADFTIVAPVPFVVDGLNGSYELPRLSDLSADQIALLAPVREAESEADSARVTRRFILSLCPDMADEPLSDMGYIQLFKALAEGSGISVGES